MLFTLEKAFEIKNHYERMLIGLPLVDNDKMLIHGLFVSPKDKVDEVSLRLLTFDFIEVEIFIDTKKDERENYEVYVYNYTGEVVVYYELDANLKYKGMIQYYKLGEKVF
jgi:hypothetical protein